MKPVFDINNFPDRDYLMKCSTRAESDCFRLFLHKIGRCWADGNSYMDDDSYDEGRDIFYSFNTGHAGKLFSEKDYARNHRIIYFEDFKWDDYTEFDEELDEELDEFLNSFVTNS